MMDQVALAIVSAQLPDFSTMMEAEILRLRKYARVLTRDASAADDLIQETLTRGFLKQCLWAKGTNLRAWLFTIMHNQYVNTVRRTMREGPAVAISETEPPLIYAPSQLASLDLRDLDRALAALPMEQRSVILLVSLEGMRYDAVAEIMGVPIGTVRSRLSRGRDALRRLMGIVPDESLQSRNRGKFGRAHGRGVLAATSRIGASVTDGDEPTTTMTV